MQVIQNRKKRKTSLLLKIAICAFAVYMIAALINQQVQISEKSKELSEMQQQLEEKQQVALNSLTGGSRAAGSKTADEILADIREELSCLDRVLRLLFDIDS